MIALCKKIRQLKKSDLLLTQYCFKRKSRKIAYRFAQSTGCSPELEEHHPLSGTTTAGHPGAGSGIKTGGTRGDSHVLIS
jgi:hypothetical protein